MSIEYAESAEIFSLFLSLPQQLPDLTLQTLRTAFLEKFTKSGHPTHRFVVPENGFLKTIIAVEFFFL